MKNRTTPAVAGKKLLDWLTNACGPDAVQDNWPLVDELCSLADRLQETRRLLRAAAGPERARLIRSEVALSGQFLKVWKALGLADPDGPSRGPGRPSSFDREDI